MKASTREWLEYLGTVKGNSKAKEIVQHIKDLEEEVVRLKYHSPYPEDHIGVTTTEDMNANMALFSRY